MRAPKTKRKSVTDVMTSNFEKLKSGVDRELLAFKVVRGHLNDEEEPPIGPLPLQELYVIAVPGRRGHAQYIFNIRDRLKDAGFDWLPDVKLWQRPFGNAHAMIPLREAA